MTRHDGMTQASLLITQAILATARPDQILRLMNDIFDSPEQG